MKNSRPERTIVLSQRHKRAITATRAAHSELGLAIAGKVSGMSLSVMKSRAGSSKL